MGLALEHGVLYPTLSAAQRLKTLDMIPKSFKYLCEHLCERLRRESAIPEQDIMAVIHQIIAYTFLGGRKGALKLVEDETALVGETLYMEIKNELLGLSETELAERKAQSELDINRFKRRSYKEETFQKIETKACHEVWAIDYTYINVFGFQFFICVVYELHAQGYLSLVPCDSPSKEVAIQAVLEAVDFAGTKPERCLLSDCGSQFLSFDYKALLEYLKIKDLQTPPGQPWYNGSLESGNRDLKRAILTIAMHEASNNPGISKAGTSRKAVLDFLKSCCLKAQTMINEEIPRVKFKTTPKAVWSNETANRKKERDSFVEKKKKERKQRMEKIKQGVIKCKNKTVDDKVKTVWRKISKAMSLNELFTFTELLNRRYQTVTN